MPEWIYLLIRHYIVYPYSYSLLYHILNKSQLLISTDGSRIHNKSGGSWIIVLTDGTKLISGHNPEFGRHVDINSYHSEIYASLSSLTFLGFFCNYFSLQLSNDIHATCDDKSYVTKMNEFISHRYSKLFIHKIKESEAYLAVLSCLPTNFVITHIKGHQDEQKSYQVLTIEEKLNVDADAIATSCATKSLNTHLPSAPFVIYVKGECVYHHLWVNKIVYIRWVVWLLSYWFLIYVNGVIIWKFTQLSAASLCFQSIRRTYNYMTQWFNVNILSISNIC